MKIISRLLSIVMVLCAVAAVCPRAQAGAVSYAGKRKRIYCGVVQLIHSIPGATSTSPPTSVITNLNALNNLAISGSQDPFAQTGVLFAKLDSLTAMKPGGWTFENPLTNIQDKLNPNYWLVPIASARNLSRLDVLYFPGSGTINLTDEERENLRRFVDGGGVLWVDNADCASPLQFGQNGKLFIPQVGFISTSNNNRLLYPVSRHHPLVSSPYWLTDVDIMSLGMGVTGQWASCCYSVPTYTPGDQVSYDLLYPIIDSMSGMSEAQLPTVVANAYGGGRVVATSDFIGKACLLPQPYCLADLKLAYNIMAYASSWTDIRKNPRRTGSSIDTLGSNALIEKWSLPSQPPRFAESAAIIYKNTVFYTSGNTLYALDANGDNNYGLWGPVGPKGQVVIWAFPVNGAMQLSAPCVATMQNPDPQAPDCSPIEAVMVMDDQGIVHVLPAFPLNPDGSVAQIKELCTVATAPGTPGSGVSSSGAGIPNPSKWPSPPVYVNGWIYALGGNGRMYASNPCLIKSGATPAGSPAHWKVPDDGKNDQGVQQVSTGYETFTASPRCGPSFGYMKGIYNGAVVGSVWWATSRRTDGSLGSSRANDQLWAVPVTVANDRISRYEDPTMDSSGNVIQATLHANFRGWLTAPDPSNPLSAIRIYRSDGVSTVNVATVVLNQNNGAPNQPGYITIGVPGGIPHGARIYASYSLTYGTQASDITKYAPTTNPPPIYCWEIEPKSFGASAVDNNGQPLSYDGTIMHHETFIPGSPAMGPDNYIYLCGTREGQGSTSTGTGTSTESDGGSILSYLYDGSIQGSPALKCHYFLHSGLDNNTGPAYAPGENILIPGVVFDPQSKTNMLNPQPCASPAVSSGKLFVTLSGDAGGPRGALVCLKSQSEFTIRITTNGGFDSSGNPIKKPKSLNRQTEDGHYTVKIWQPNLINPPSGAAPMIDARSVSGGISVDYDNGTITFNDFSQTKLQTHGAIETNTFSPSLPVWVFLDNVEVPIDWTTWRPGAVSNGMPYGPFGTAVGGGPGGKPITTSASTDSVDLSNWNNLLWYYILPPECTGCHSPPVVVGNTVYFVTDDGILYALNAETGESGGTITTQKPLWTQPVGAAIDPTTAVSVAGSNGVLLVPAGDGLHTYTNSTTLVADNNRLVEIDGAGNVSWADDAIVWPASIPTAAGQPMAIKQGPVNKPGHARYASTGEILFANTGANQVAKIDKSGLVGFDGAGGLYSRWLYENFADPRHLLGSGQSRKLHGPTDAIMWQEMEPGPTNSDPGTSVVHCVIADSGNSRILDLVYRVKANRFVDYKGDPILDNPAYAGFFDPDSHFVLPELNWISKTDSLNQKYAYTCLQLVPTVNGTNIDEQVWVASSDLASTGSGDTSPKGAAGLGGAILALGYRTRSAGAPGSSGGGGGTAAGAWNYKDPKSGTVVARCDHVLIDGTVSPLANPRYFEVIESPNGSRTLLVCDNYGVYQLDLSAISADKPNPPVVQHLWEKEYALLHRLPGPSGSLPFAGQTPPRDAPPLMASCAQRLSNGKWLVANSYVGPVAGSVDNFNGEVFEYDPTKGPAQDVMWCSPHVEWVNPGISWKQSSSNTYNLRQPKSACRQ